MKRLLLLLGCSGALLCGADLAGVHSVYLMPMSRGLDQYLANRLTNEHVFQVVTDPKLADAIFTDRLGEAFQNELEAISPTPKPPEPEKKAEEPAVEKAGKKHAKTDDSNSVLALVGDTAEKTPALGTNSAFGRGKGNIFLVDAKSRQVVWSIFDPPKGMMTANLDRTASDIVSRLKKDLRPPKNPPKKK